MLTGNQMNLMQIVLGGIVLLTGSRLTWLFTGVIAFVFGMYAASDLFHIEARWIIQIIGLASGLAGGVLMVYFPQITLGVVSFISGGYGLYFLGELFGIKSNLIFGLLFIIGGILGIILMVKFDRWGLIILASLAGATLASKHFYPKPPLGMAVLIFVLLMMVGISFQAWGLKTLKL